jgi:hypothetical protein
LKREFRYNLYGDLTWWAEWVIQTTIGIQPPHRTPRTVQKFDTRDEAVLWLREKAKAEGVMNIPESIPETKVWLPLGIIPST